MKRCMKCGTDTEVMDTRTRVDGIIRRRRRCPSCSGMSTTLEVPVSHDERAKDAVLWAAGFALNPDAED